MDQNSLPKKILLVDDDAAVAEAVTGFLRKHNINVVRALDLDTAIYQFNQQIFDVVVIELEFDALPGLALVQKFRQSEHQERRSTGVVLASGNQKKTTDDGLLSELGDIEQVAKPFTDVKLLPALARALQKKRSVAEYEAVRETSFNTLRLQGDVNAAIGPVKKAMPKLQMKGMQLMAALYEEASQYGEALKIIDSMLQKKPDDIAMLNSKGRLLMKSGDLIKAKEFLEKSDKLAPKNIERIRAMAEMYLKVNNPDASAGKMRELIELTPENRDLRFELFRELETAGYVDHAIGLCRETTLPAEVVRYYNNKGVLLSKSTEHLNALREYESALRIYPTFKENFRIYFNVAIAEANLKNADSLKRAIAALQKCLQLAPEFEKAKTLLAQIEKNLAQITQKAG